MAPTLRTRKRQRPPTAGSSRKKARKSPPSRSGSASAERRLRRLGPAPRQVAGRKILKGRPARASPSARIERLTPIKVSGCDQDILRLSALTVQMQQLDKQRDSLQQSIEELAKKLRKRNQRKGRK